MDSCSWRVGPCLSAALGSSVAFGASQSLPGESRGASMRAKYHRKTLPSGQLFKKTLLGYSRLKNKVVLVSSDKGDFKVIFFFFKPCDMWDLNSLTRDHDQGSNLCCLQWKCRVLTSGLPGKSLYMYV